MTPAVSKHDSLFRRYTEALTYPTYPMQDFSRSCIVCKVVLCVVGGCWCGVCCLCAVWFCGLHDLHDLHD
jgi:hypothetical protein